MGKFLVEPEIVRQKGREMVNLSDEFNANMNKLYNTMDQMLATDYMAPEAYTLADEIRKFKPELNTMRTIINNYGTFCMNTSTDVENNQQDLTEEMRLG